MVSGATHAEDIKGTGAELEFTRVIDKKVDNTFVDREHCKLVLLASGKVQLHIQMSPGNFFIKTLTRVDAPGAPPATQASTTNPSPPQAAGPAFREKSGG